MFSKFYDLWFSQYSMIWQQTVFKLNKFKQILLQRKFYSELVDREMEIWKLEKWWYWKFEKWRFFCIFSLKKKIIKKNRSQNTR